MNQFFFSSGLHNEVPGSGRVIVGEFCGRIQIITVKCSIHYAALDFFMHCRLAGYRARGSGVDQRSAFPGRETATASCREPGGNPGKNVFMADCLLAALASAFRKQAAAERIKLEQVFGIQRETRQ